jgi:hypothetical protein
MKHFLILVPVLLLAIYAESAAQAPPSTATQSVPLDQENARQARALLDQAIQALGGDAYLNVHDIETSGRTYSFHHGRPTSNGVLYWRFVEYPDKERIEVTKERDIATVFNGDKAYEVTFKGPHEIEKKDLDDYLRRRKFSLETLLRVWRKDPTVALLFVGEALAGNVEAKEVTLINSKDEAVNLFFDLETHLPIKKSYKWRDPVDKELNIEEETYDNYRPVQGIMTPYGFTRYFNGDMQNERFLNSASYNQPLNPAMFDAFAHYNPIKEAEKRSKK